MAPVNRIGFTRLGASSARDGPYRFNVIFVHGLRGHPKHAWVGDPLDNQSDTKIENVPILTGRGFLRRFGRVPRRKAGGSKNTDASSSPEGPFWPEEFLAEDIPEARVWTYGYNADVIKGLFKAGNQNTISRHGEDLAVRFGREVDNLDPVVFIAHSLGGIIVKDALRRSDKCQAQTKLLIFLGTPHRGSAYAGWGQIASNLARVALQDSNKKIFQSLEVNGEVLDNIQEEFKTIVHKYGLKVHSFQEARGLSGIKGLDGKIVDDFSSKVDLPRTHETVESIDAGHRQMARCSDKSDNHYRAIVGILRKFLEISPSLPSETGPPPVLEQTPGPWFLVPYPRNKDFVGRSAVLQKLHQQPFESTSQTRVSLFGLGGIGKTQIALEYTCWVQETHPDMSVFWVHASNAERFRQSFTWIAHECCIPGHDDPKTDVLPLVARWLERKDRGSWLMVIDNADDAQLFFSSPREPGQASQEEPLGQYIPECAHGSILVTTRNKQAGLKLTKGRPPIEIDTMDDTESKQLLRTRLGQEVAYGELSALSCRLEYLPLALVQAAAFMEANTMAVEEYLRLLNKSDQHLVDLLSEDFETVGRDSKAPRAVAETWILSFEQVQQQDAFAGELLSLMSFFDRQAIPTEFLAYYGREHHQDDYGDLQLQKALGLLKAFSFVTMGKDESLDMHRLVQLVSRKWLAREERMEHFIDQALFAVSDAYPYGDYENWVTCRKYLPHVYTVLRFEGSGSEDEKLARAYLLHNAAGFFLQQRHWEDAERFLDEVVDLTRNMFGAGHPNTLSSMGHLASTYSRQGQWKKAENLGLQVLETSRTKLGKDHFITLASMDSLASIYWDQSLWEEAEKLEAQVMEAYKATLGAHHPKTLGTVANLALIFLRKGWLEEAEELQVQVTEMSKIMLGADHPNTLLRIVNLAMIFKEQGQFEEAENLNLEVIKACKAKLGPDHPLTLTSMVNLATIYAEQGRLEEAEKLGLEVIGARKTKLGPDHPDTLTSMNNLAYTWKVMGRHRDALLLMETCLTLRKQVLGLDHPSTVSSLQKLTEWQKESESLA